VPHAETLAVRAILDSAWALVVVFALMVALHATQGVKLAVMAVAVEVLTALNVKKDIFWCLGVA
jgi:hypothetical protein